MSFKEFRVCQARHRLLNMPILRLQIFGRRETIVMLMSNFRHLPVDEPHFQFVASSFAAFLRGILTFLDAEGVGSPSQPLCPKMLRAVPNPP